MARITSRPSLEANPKIDISHKLRNDEQPPVVQVVYGALLASLFAQENRLWDNLG